MDQVGAADTLENRLEVVAAVEAELELPGRNAWDKDSMVREKRLAGHAHMHTQTRGYCSDAPRILSMLRMIEGGVLLRATHRQAWQNRPTR